MAAQHHGDGKDALRLALEEFHRSDPAFGARSSALILENLRQVLQFAAGRAVQGPGPDAQLERAAQFFVRRKLLRPQANHYELLGLQKTCSEAQLKEHYRLLMRLLHPDFAGATDARWPADAASRINLTYETLGSRERRKAYDSSLERTAPAGSPA